MVKRKTIEHFAHIETNFAVRVGQSFSYLPEHRIVIDIDFYKWGVLTIDKCQIAICTVIGTAVRDRNQFVVRTATDVKAKPTIEMSYKR